MLLFKALLLSIALRQCSFDTICVQFQDKAVIDDDPDGVWTAMINEGQSITHTSRRGQWYQHLKYDEVEIVTEKWGKDVNLFSSCHRFNPSHVCTTSRVIWNGPELLRDEKLLKLDMVLLDKPFHECLIAFYMMDWFHYGYAVSTHVVTDAPFLKFRFFLDTSVKSNNSFSAGRTATIYMIDRADQCKDFRPKEQMTGVDTMSTALYVNMVQREDKSDEAPAFFFIKKDSNICIYRFPVKEFFWSHEFDPQQFHLLKNYPTAGYAPKFFTFDPLYATFVSLYWNKVRGTHPEAHFYVLNEKNPELTQMVDRFVLTDFDQDVLEDIFAEKVPAKAYPNFKAWGRQIFFSFTKVETNHEFAAVWKNEQEFFIMNRGAEYVIKLWHAKKDYVQHWYPAVYNENSPAVNGPSTTTTTTQTTSTKSSPAMTTTSEASSSLSTASSTVTKEISSTSTMQSSTTTMEETSSSTTLDSSTVSTDEEDGYLPEDGIPASQNGKQVNDAGVFGNIGDCGAYPWLSIVFVILSAIVIAGIVTLVIFGRRGAKKLKAAVARRKKPKGAAKPRPKKAVPSPGAAAAAKPFPKKATPRPSPAASRTSKAEPKKKKAKKPKQKNAVRGKKSVEK